MTNPFLARRLELRMTQEQAARACGVTLSTWKNWETARFSPQRSKYAELREGLGWTTDQLLDAVRELEKQAMTAA